MMPPPRRAVSSPLAPPADKWTDIDDDDGWQDMPVVRSDDNPFGLDEEEKQRLRYHPPARLDAYSSQTAIGGPIPPTGDSSVPSAGAGAGPSTSNATGAHLELDADTLSTDDWRQKRETDESEYTRLRLEEDEESEEVHMRTKYLFNEDKAMTPLSQMQATKELLTEGQRIAYVGLCSLMLRRMVREMGRGWEGLKVKSGSGLVGGKGKGKGKEEVPVVESASIWMLKVMARLYQHMEIERDEQRMIESLAEHGVDPSDLVPALMTTHTVNNPDFDPKAKKQAELETLREEQEEEDPEAGVDDAPPPYSAPEPLPAPGRSASPSTSLKSPSPASASETGRSRSVSASDSMFSPPKSKPINPFDEDDDEEEVLSLPAPAARPPPLSLPMGDDDDGDIGRSHSPSHTPTKQIPDPIVTIQSPTRITTSPTRSLQSPSARKRASRDCSSPTDEKANGPDEVEGQVPEISAPLPSLPGVSTSLSNTDETVTLDIRWTVLCDLFLVLIADSVYDARSRAFLERVAIALGFTWLDVVRFENRITDALEIQEVVEKTQSGEIIEGRRKAALRKRYAMMGLAAVGGGLVIGLSAGLLAPMIGAGLGAALGTIGVTGTTGFLAGAGGAAMITTGGVVTGMNIAGKGMARRTREVRTFELRPLHNNRKVTCYITMGGFMASKMDDVRLPFSTLDHVIGDVLSVHWEPEMMAEMGSALKILTTEILTQVGQQVLAATVMTALMSALQWPFILTKLGYLIDNPWSNALDRARAAGLVLADTIINRHAGVRPVSLIGFSLGARAIFYCLVELARVKAYGLVQDVFLFGTTVTASRTTWVDVRSAVAGRFVNGYAANDWMLAYLFRATSGGVNTVAGLRPVETVQGMENVEVTDVITGHMSYRSCMPQLLAKVGFPVTAEYFDEPDDPDADMTVQERTIVNEGEEDPKKDRKKILGLFPRKGSRTTAPSSPNPDVARSRSPSQPYDPDDDELPPRETEASGDIGTLPAAGVSKESVATNATEDEAVRGISKTAGFDFQAISKELGKDINVDKLPADPAPRPKEPINIALQSEAKSPVERSGSAPPITITTPSADPPPRAEYMAARSVSYDITNLPRDDGDISAMSEQAENLSLGGQSPVLGGMPSWDRPSSAPALNQSPTTSPSLSAGGGWKGGGWGFNAWSAGSGSAPGVANTTNAGTASAGVTGLGLGIPRAAPPARPHPPELMANPFASNGDLPPGMLGGWTKREEDATKNPW